MKKYSLRLVTPNDVRQIVELEPSFLRVRAIAKSIKQKHGRKIIISVDGKDLPGGAHALDTIAYEHWLSTHQSESSDNSQEVIMKKKV